MLDEGLKFGFTRTAVRDMAGTASFNRLRRLALSSGLLSVTPVTFPPGRAKLATRPTIIGSETPAKTSGTVLVAFRAARDPGVEYTKMTSDLSRTRSAASSGRRPYVPSA